MKAQDLIKVIDKLVEKKFDAKLRQLIKEEVSSEINKAMGRVLVEMVKEVKKVPSNENTHTEEKQLTSPINTNNPRLNSVLAETARNFKPLQKTSDSGGSLAELMNGGFDKIGNVNEVAYDDEQKSQSEPDGSNIGFLKSMVTEGTVGQQRSVLGTDAVPDILKGVFKKDFRAVMRKIDEQKKTGTSGLIDPRTVLSG